MKKILLLILVILCVFQLNGLAVAIDMGSEAVVGDGYENNPASTYINRVNPANATGIIQYVDFYAHETMYNVRVATFYVVSGYTLSTRDYEIIGTVSAGYQHITGITLYVEAGDYIGFSKSSGHLRVIIVEEHEDCWGIDEDGHIPCTNQTFYGYTNVTISLYAFGVTSPPPQVTGVSATNGVHADKVRVTWNEALIADGYDVWDGDEWIDVGDVQMWDDTNAPAPTITHGDITASDGTSTAHIALSNTGASANNGSSISYKVRAYNATGNGPESAYNSGFRKPGTLTYQWYRSNVDGDSGYGSIGGATASTHNDTDAPAPTITVGAASASDGTSSDYVTLSIAGESANIGAGRYYKCYHTATGANPGYTGVNRGYRGVGVLTYQWQRSSGDADDDYSNIDGATTDPYNDTEAPESGSGRYFKCVENATGATQVTTNADRGYRIPVGITWNDTTITKWNNITVGEINTQ